MTDTNEQTFPLADEEATLAFGRRLGLATIVGDGPVNVGAVIHLHGDLGAGKTTLTRGLLRAYGYAGAVKSPTYTLVEPYELGPSRIYHFDLYRLAMPEEVDYLGVEEYFQPENLCLIEWAEHGGRAIPAPDLKIDIDIAGTGRLLRCVSLTDRGREICKRL